jgi:hypothetical protein
MEPGYFGAASAAAIAGPVYFSFSKSRPSFTGDRGGSTIKKSLSAFDTTQGQSTPP